MNFRALSEALRPTAESVAKYLREERGLSKIKAEEAVRTGLPLASLHCFTNEYELVWVEFSEKQAFPEAIVALVQDVKAEELPCKMYVALPAASETSAMKDLIRAKNQGVGILLVRDDQKVLVVQEAVSQLHIHVRKPDPGQFPTKYKELVTNAHNTYISGNPVKGCSDVYDEIEDLSRRIADLAIARTWWSGTHPKNVLKDPWASVLESAFNNMDFSKFGGLTKQVWTRVMAITDYRNKVNHKPKSVAARKARDLELRTRFETATDLLRDLSNAVKPLRL